MAKHFSTKALRTVVRLKAQNFDRHGYVLFTHRAKRLPFARGAKRGWNGRRNSSRSSSKSQATQSAGLILNLANIGQQQHRQCSLSFLGSPPRCVPRIGMTAHEGAWTPHLRALYQLLSFIVFNEPGHNSKEQICGDSAHQHAARLSTGPNSRQVSGRTRSP